VTEPSALESFDVAAHLDEVTDLVRRVGDLSLRWYRDLDTIDNKQEIGFDPVTEADRAVESELRSALEARFTGHEILGEEFGRTGAGPYRWTIDPIDGTRAFIIGQPMWGTLLGFQVEDRPVAGWLHQPVLGETLVGHGTCRLHTAAGSREVRVSGTERLDEAVVLCTHPTMFAPGDQAAAFERVASGARMVRYSGDCLNYGLVAMGLADAVVENGLAAYDIVPLIPIVEAAGGVVTDLEGRSPIDGGYVVAAATPALHEAILTELNRG
jgi:histidinol phosphatase-like enzyme (inositol monophosphatase family)